MVHALRYEQKKYYQQMKGTQGCNHQGNWFEDGKIGRLLILFASMIISSYVKHIWKSTGLKKRFGSLLDILDEMRSV